MKNYSFTENEIPKKPEETPKRSRTSVILESVIAYVSAIVIAAGIAFLLGKK